MSLGKGGGLTINTGAAAGGGGGGLFGSNTSQSQPAGGLFGSSQTSQPQQTTSLFGQSQTTQQQQTGGLFGSATSQPQQTGGLFGSSTSQPQQGGGLFGSSVSQSQPAAGLFGSTTSQPQQAGGLFGSSTSQPQQMGALFGQPQPQPQPQQQQQAGGLFESSASQPQQSGGLFGSSTSQPQQSGRLFGQSQQAQQQQSGGLFGSNMAQQQSQPQPSLFGGAQSQPTRPSLFSSLSAPAPANAQRPSLFSQQTSPPQQSNLFGQSGMQPARPTLGQSLNRQQTVPGVKIDLSNVRPTTRFSDLHEDLQKVIEQLDQSIMSQMEIQKQIVAALPNHQNMVKEEIPNDVDFVTRRMETTVQMLDNDAAAIHRESKTLLADAEDAKLSFRAIDNLKLPPQYHHQGGWGAYGASGAGQPADGEHSTDLVSYFSRQTELMAKTLKENDKNMRDIEEALRAVEARTSEQISIALASRGKVGDQRGPDEVATLVGILNEFEGGIVRVAQRVYQSRDAVEDLVRPGRPNGLGGDVKSTRY